MRRNQRPSPVYGRGRDPRQREGEGVSYRTAGRCGCGRGRGRFGSGRGSSRPRSHATSLARRDGRSFAKAVALGTHTQASPRRVSTERRPKSCPMMFVSSLAAVLLLFKSHALSRARRTMQRPCRLRGWRKAQESRRLERQPHPSRVSSGDVSAARGITGLGNSGRSLRTSERDGPG